MSWSPASQTSGGYSPTLWLNAGSLGLADGAAISSWSDQSSQANHAVQADANYKPTYVAYALNNLPAVRFYYTGTYQPWLGGPVTGMNSAVWSAFAVYYGFQYSTFTVTPFYMGIGDGSGTLRRGFCDIETGNILRAPEYFTAACIWRTAAIPSLNRDWNIASFVYDASSTSNVPEAFVNLTSQSVTPSATPSGTVFTGSDRYGLGRTGALANSKLYVNIAELIYYSQALSALDRSQVEHYLSDKYNIQRPGIAGPSVGFLGTPPVILGPSVGFLGTPPVLASPYGGVLGKRRSTS